MSTKLLPWQSNVIALSVIYAALEQGKRLPLLLEGDDVFLGPVLDDMHRQGLVEPSSSRGEWRITKQGDDLRGRMVAMYDQLLKFEIFANVNHTLQLTSDQSPDGLYVYDNLLDPRFTASPASVDLRLAVLDWYGAAAQDQLGGKAVDPYQIVFMQKLRAGHYSDVRTGKLNADYWFNLRVGKVFQDIDAIVTTAVKWQDLGNGVDESSAVMNAIYAAGMAEQVKRDGERCTCGAYLGMYAYYAAKEGKTLDSCPSCNGSFTPPAPTGEMCPNCNTDIRARQRKCYGCGARIDRSMAAGTVREVTTVTESYETYYNPWGGSYVSYGYYAPAPVYYGVWYDPYDPVANVLAFGLLCALL